MSSEESDTADSGGLDDKTLLDAQNVRRRAMHMYRNAMATKNVTQENVCLYIDGYHYYKSVKTLRNSAFNTLLSTVSVPLIWKQASVKLSSIPKPFLSLHDLTKPSPSQLRDLSFTLLREAFDKMSSEIVKIKSGRDSIFYWSDADVAEKCNEAAKGTIEESTIDRITHVLKFNYEVRIGYAMLDRRHYRSELEKRRTSAKSSPVSDMAQIQSIRAALDALEKGEIITKDTISTSTERHDAKFPLPLEEYYEFIQGIPLYRARDKLQPGFYKFSIDPYGVNDLAEFQEKQVDVGLAVAATEKICDREEMWSVGIVTGDTDYLPVFRGMSRLMLKSAKRRHRLSTYAAFVVWARWLFTEAVLAIRAASALRRMGSCL